MIQQEAVRHQSLSDEQLVSRFRAGLGPASERELVDEIFARYHARVAAWCYRFTRDRETSLDLTQEIFIKAFRRFRTFRSDSKLSTWLYSITRNHCIDAVNKRAGEPVDSVDLATVRMADPMAVNAEVTLADKQRRHALLNMVASSLNPLESRVMALHYGHELPINDVTSLLKLTNASGAKAYIVSARRKLSAAVKTVRSECYS